MLTNLVVSFRLTHGVFEILLTFKRTFIDIHIKLNIRRLVKLVSGSS